MFRQKKQQLYLDIKLKAGTPVMSLILKSLILQGNTTTTNTVGQS